MKEFAASGDILNEHDRGCFDERVHPLVEGGLMAAHIHDKIINNFETQCIQAR